MDSGSASAILGLHTSMGYGYLSEFTCSKLTIERLEQVVTNVQS